MYTYTHPYIHTHTYTQLYIHTHTYTHSYIHTYTYTCMHTYIHTRPVARGGVGGVVRPPQLPIPKILFHPLAILFHPLAILFHPLAILFHPLAILFHPWNMWMTSHGQCPRGGACECPRVGAFFKLMTSRGQCPRGGGAPGVPPIQVQTPPPPPTWLAGYGPAYIHVHTYCTQR